MKKYLLLVGGFLLAGVLQATPTETSEEKQLLNDFLQAIYAQRAQDPNTLAYFEKTILDSPDSKYLKRTIVLQALSENKLDVAERYIDFIETEDNTAEDWNAYAAYLWKRGRLKEAEEAYQKAIAFDPEDMQQLYPYLMLLSVSAPEKAVQALEKIAVDYPSLAAAAYTEAGNIFLRRQNLQLAFNYYEKALKVNPEEVNARLGKAEIYERSSQFFLMLHELEELEKLGFGNASTYSKMASVYLLGKDFEKAEQYFLKAKKLQPDDVPSCYFLALLAEQKGDFEGAISYLTQAGDYPQDPAKWLQVSFYQQKLNQMQASAKTLQTAHQKFPDNVEITFFYGLALQQIHDYKQAARVFERLTTQRPEYTEAWLQYAYALESLKKYDTMEQAIRRVLELDANHAPALNLWAYSLAQRGIRLEEAQGYIARALARNPKDYAFIDTQAWIYFKQGKLAQAENLLRNIPIDIIKLNPELGYHLGAVLAAQGRAEEALPYLDFSRRQIPEAEKLYRKLSKNR